MLRCSGDEQSVARLCRPAWRVQPYEERALTTEALAVSGINALYGDSHVLHDVSFSLKQGRLLGLQLDDALADG